MRRCLTEAGEAAEVPDAGRINLQLLVRLRWIAIVGQLVTIAAVEVLMNLELAPLPLLAVIGAEIGSNLACDLWARRGNRAADALLALILAADVCFLTALLALTGGAYNPFSFLYLIHIALAAVTLPGVWAWGLVALATALFGSLFLLPADHAQHAQHFRIHLEGMWLAFAIAALFIVHFVKRVTQALAERELELAAARSLAARNERLASLMTLAAGAAHELGTPLATIAVAAKELEHQLAQLPDGHAAYEDARLIGNQLQRCRAILRQMTHAAGDSLGEAARVVTVEDLIANALMDISGVDAVRVEIGAPLAATELRLPLDATALALRNVLKNAIDASAAGGQVVLTGRRLPDSVELEVRDRGGGMSDEVIARLGEPFFSTKEAGQGMGLGLFLSRSVFARVGARLEITSTPGTGTNARIVFTLAPPVTVHQDAHE